MITGDTIAAIATAPGRGGVAVVRVSGPEAFSIGRKVTSADGRVVGWSADRMTNRISAQHALFYDLSSEHRSIRPSEHVIDDGIILAFKAPHSYTGEDVVEFQCHGGTVTPRRVLEACLAAGARLARRGEFTERAFLNGRLDYSQAESVLDLIDAKTTRAADAALEGLSGRRQCEIRALYESALDLSTRLEHALDVDEGELPPDFLPSVHSSLLTLHSSLRAALSKAAEGRLLKSGALVVLAGQPNAGKSSLLNALLDENRAIVSDVPGTTRDSIEAWIDLDGWPIRLVDTAGLREAKDEVEGEGVRRSEDLIAKADVVVLFQVSGFKFHVPGFDSINLKHETCNLKLIPIHAKCDLGRGEGLNVSAKTGAGIEDLKRAIVAKLEEKVAASDSGDTPEGDVMAYHEALALLAPLFPLPSSLFPSSDLVLLANAVRSASERLGEAIGATYSSDLLDNLFSRFCVGK